MPLAWWVAGTTAADQRPQQQGVHSNLSSLAITNNKAHPVLLYFYRLQADAIRDSLKALFAEPELPDNPFYYLAAALGAYVDQNDLWSETDVQIIAALDNEGGLDVADAASKLCKLATASSCVLGLPHVLRTVSSVGAQIVHDVLTNSLPDSMFRSATPITANRPGYTIQLLSSVQVRAHLMAFAYACQSPSSPCPDDVLEVAATSWLTACISRAGQHRPVAPSVAGVP